MTDQQDALSGKDSGNVAIARAIKKEFGNLIRFTNDWDADLCAIGISSATHPHRLLYLSTLHDVLRFQLELDAEAQPGVVHCGSEESTLSELLAAVTLLTAKA